MEKLKQETPDLTQQNIERIAELFPSVVTETKDSNGNLKKAVNFAVLKQILSDEVVDGDECYEFTWVGKKQSIIEGNKPIRKTLRPAKDESKNWDTTENLYIEGDNLEVLKLLQNSYLNSIKMIYIDPPYNTGNDFVYRDDFAVSREDYEDDLGLYDEDENRLFKNTETNGRFHSDWCSMMYPRLQLARNLLSDDGVIFISIDDNEVDSLRKICDEVFGEVNFISQFIWEKKKKPSFLNKNLGVKIEYIICFCKNRISTGAFSVDLTEEGKKYPFNNAGNGLKDLTFPVNSVFFNIPDGIVVKQDMSEGRIVTRLLNNIEIKNGRNANEFTLQGEWRYSQEKLNEIVENEEVIIISKIPFRPNHVKTGGEIKKIHNLLTLNNYEMLGTNEDADNEQVKLFGYSYFDYTKPTGLLKFLIKALTYNDKNSIVLDFFSGSATTADAVMQLNAEDGGNRKFIMVQLPEATDEKSEANKAGYKNICEIGKERIRRAGKKIEEELQAKSTKGELFKNEEEVKTVDTGFRVLKLDSTNMKDVYYSAGEYSQQLLLDLESNIKEDRTDLDLLYGVLLDWGVSLSLPHISETIDGKKVHFVNETDLVACFEEEVNEDIVREIAKRKPLRVVFRDSCFSSSPEKINVSEIFKTLSPDTTIKVI